MSPLIGEYHSKFWSHPSTGVAAAPAVRLGGYPLWQATVVTTLGPLGYLSAWWDTGREQLRWWWQVIRQIAQLSRRGKQVIRLVLDALQAVPEPYLTVTVGADLAKSASARAAAAADYQADAEAVLAQVAAALQHPAYGAAHQAVRQTATTIGFNDPQTWVRLSHTIRDHADWADNTWRHLNACHLTDQAMREQGSTLTNGDRHLLVQLAYTGFAKRRR